MVRRGFFAAVMVLTVSSCPGFDDRPLPSSFVPPKLVLAAEACAALSRCFDFSDGERGGVDVCTRVFLDSDGPPRLDAARVKVCLDAADDCAAMGRCINAGRSTVSCDPTTVDRACAGTVAQGCVGVVVSQDCAGQGMDCVQDRVGQFWCGLPGECGENRCEGNGALNCLNGVMVYQDCGAGSCRVSGGQARCVGEGGPCEEGDFYCEGKVAVSCREGRVHREQCARCSEEGGAFCVPATQCQRSSCAGSVLLACIDGLTQEIDCTDLGGTVCQLEGGARCVD